MGRPRRTGPGGTDQGFYYDPRHGRRLVIDSVMATNWGDADQAEVVLVGHGKLAFASRRLFDRAGGLSPLISTLYCHHTDPGHYPVLTCPTSGSCPSRASALHIAADSDSGLV